MKPIQSKGDTVTLLNVDKHSFKIDVVDFHTNMGVSIDRVKNKERGLKPFEGDASGKNNILINFTLYVP